MELTARIVTLRLAETFVISRESSDEEHVLQVELRHDGVVGYGEGAAIDRYEETAETALGYVEEHGALLGDDPFALEEIEARLPAGQNAARAALDGALHDLQGKLARRSGLAPARPAAHGPADVVDRLARRSGRHGAARREGGDALPAPEAEARRGDGLDVERVRAVRGVTELPLQVDVNEWWSLDEALDALPQLAELGVAYCEQPLPAGDEGGRTLKARSPLPIYVDEDCHRLADVAACAEIAHGINIKLAKSGGIREAIRMAHAARALGLGVMLGCMIESGLGIAAGCTVAPLCDHVDLDGNLLIAEDPWPGVAFVDGVQVPSGRPGLGVAAA